MASERHRQCRRAWTTTTTTCTPHVALPGAHGPFRTRAAAARAAATWSTATSRRRTDRRPPATPACTDQREDRHRHRRLHLGRLLSTNSYGIPTRIKCRRVLEVRAFWLGVRFVRVADQFSASWHLSPPNRQSKARNPTSPARPRPAPRSIEAQLGTAAGDPAPVDRNVNKTALGNVSRLLVGPVGQLTLKRLPGISRGFHHHHHTRVSGGCDRELGAHGGGGVGSRRCRGRWSVVLFSLMRW